MLDEIPYEPDKPIPPMPRRFWLMIAVAELGCAAMIALCVYASPWIWTDLVHPLYTGGPIVEINSMTFFAPLVLPAIICVAGMFTITLLGYLLRWKRGAIDRIQEKLHPIFLLSGLAGIFGNVLGGIVGGTITETQGYLYCDAASTTEVKYYRRVYVQHPFLCVDEEQLPEQLALYHQLAAAQKAGRLREAITDAGLSVNENGHIVRSPPSRGR